MDFLKGRLVRVELSLKVAAAGITVMDAVRGGGRGGKSTVIHSNGNVSILAKFSSLAALRVSLAALRVSLAALRVSLAALRVSLAALRVSLAALRVLPVMKILPKCWHFHFSIALMENTIDRRLLRWFLKRFSDIWMISLHHVIAFSPPHLPPPLYSIFWGRSTSSIGILISTTGFDVSLMILMTHLWGQVYVINMKSKRKHIFVFASMSYIMSFKMLTSK